MMSVLWDWIILVVLLGGAGYLAYRYYRGQVAKYGESGHNPAADEWRGKGGCCH